MHKATKSRRFLRRFLRELLETGWSLIRNVLKPLAKSTLIPLRLTAAAPTTNAAIHKKMFGSGTTALTISNEEMHNLMKIVKFLKNFGLLIKDVSK